MKYLSLAFLIFIVCNCQNDEPTSNPETTKFPTGIVRVWDRELKIVCYKSGPYSYDTGIDCIYMGGY